MKKISKLLILTTLFVSTIFASVTPAFAYYGAWGVHGKTWPPVLTGWTVKTASGVSTINWNFSDPSIGGSTGGGIPDLSAQYPDWNQSNNMDIVLWAQNHHYQTPLNGRFYWAAVLPTDKQPSNYTGPAPCSYSSQILSIIDATGHTPADFYAAGKAPLSGSTTLAQASTSTPTQTPKTTVTSASVITPKTSAPVVSKTQTPVSPEVAQQHSDPVSDPSSVTHATIAKIDNAKQAADDKAKADAQNKKRYIIYGLLALALIIAIGVVGFIYLRELKQRRKV